MTSDARPSPAQASNNRVLIILPTLNEVGNIGPLLAAIRAQLASTAHDICVIDDGSTDGTVGIVESFSSEPESEIHLIQRVKTMRGSQRGGAVQAGLEWGLRHRQYAVYIEMDADFAHRPEDLPRGIELIDRNGYNVAIASKYVPGSKVVNRPWLRRLVSQCARLLARTLLGWQITDYSNSFRFYDSVAARVIARSKVKYISPIYLAEAIGMWRKAGMRIAEFPFTYVERVSGTSKLRSIDVAKAMLGLFEIAFRFHVTGFRPRTNVAPTAEATLLTNEDLAV